jgi:hypothetical protein
MIRKREALAWAAGFFDGEGSVHVAYSKRRSDDTFYYYPQVGISQSGDIGDEPLRKFYQAVGIPAKIYGPYRPAKNQKLVRWVYEASGLEKVQKIADLLWPFLGTVKRNKFSQVLAKCKTSKPRRVVISHT